MVSTPSASNGSDTPPPFCQVDLLSLPVSQVDSEAGIVQLVKSSLKNGDCRIFTFVNPYSYYLTKEHVGYARDLAAFDGVFCDGIGLVLALRLLALPAIPRISFDSTSLAPLVFQACCEENRRVFLLGGADGVAARAAETLKSVFPGLNVIGARSGFFSTSEEVADEVMASGAEVVICGMGAPRQEAFLLTLKDRGWRGVGFTCGGYLDQLDDGIRYYPEWVDRLNLRFLYRLFSEPRRLWKRYLVHYMPFIIQLGRAKFVSQRGVGRRK